MGENNEENKVDGVFGGVSFESTNTETTTTTEQTEFTRVDTETGTETETETETGTETESGTLPTKPSLWSKIRSFLFQEIDWNAPIKIELTPYQQKIENEINEFLHQEISFKGFWNLIKGK